MPTLATFIQWGTGSPTREIRQKKERIKRHINQKGSKTVIICR